MLKKTLRMVAFLGFGMGILYIVFRSFSSKYEATCLAQGKAIADCSLWDKLVADFLHVDVSWMLLVLLTYLISFLSRAKRWQMLLAPMGYKPHFIQALAATFIGYFANLGLPRIGELARAGALSESANIPLDKTMGTVIVDRILDFITMILVIILAFCFEYKTLTDFIESQVANADNAPNYLKYVVLFVGFVGMVLLWVFRAPLSATWIGKKVIGFLQGMMEGLLSIRKIDKMGWLIFHSLNIWMMYYLIPYFGFKAFEPTFHLGMNPALMVFVFGTLGVIIPSPGGMGTYHLLVTSALLLYGIAYDDGFSYANILFFTVNFGANIVFGLLSLLLLPVFSTKIKDAENS